MTTVRVPSVPRVLVNPFPGYETVVVVDVRLPFEQIVVVPHGAFSVTVFVVDV